MLKNHPIIDGGVALAAIGVLDHVAGAHEEINRRTQPEFHMKPGRIAASTCVVLPGCQMNGGALFKSLAPMIPHTELIVASYPEHGFDVEAVCSGLAKQIEDARAYKPSIIGQSMGGIVARHFVEYADRTGLLNKTEGLGDIILDASPYDGQDIRPKYRVLLNAASLFQDSWTVNHLKPLIMGKQHEWSARTSLGAIKAQGQFILGRHPHLNLARFADSVEYHHGEGVDPVINTEQAATKYRAYSLDAISEVIDSRASTSHTATIGHVAAMINQTNRVDILKAA